MGGGHLKNLRKKRQYLWILARKQATTQAETSIKQSEIKMKHYKNEEKRINAEMRKTEADHKNEKIKVNKLEAEVKRKQVNLDYFILM